jgi:hypothetical protein
MWKAQEAEPEKPESSEPKEAVAWQQNLLILLDSPSVTVQFDLKLYTFDLTQFIACSFKCTLYNIVYNDTDILYIYIYTIYIYIVYIHAQYVDPYECTDIYYIYNRFLFLLHNISAWNAQPILD